MRLASLAAAFVLFGSAAAQPPIDIAVTPAGVEVALWCARFPDAACRHEAAYAARAQCGAVGRRARFLFSGLIRRTFTRGQEGYFLYDCVR